MSAIDFTKKGLNQTIFSKRTNNSSWANNKLKSTEFKAIMADKTVAHVIDKAAEKRVFYDALKKRGQSADKRGITRNVLKKVLGDIEHSGEFSHHEMMDLRKHLVGGPVGSSIIREKHEPAHAEAKHEISIETSHEATHAAQKPVVKMQDVFKDIMGKSPHNQAHGIGQREAGLATSHVNNGQQGVAQHGITDFSVSSRNIHNADPLFAHPSEHANEHINAENPTDISGHASNHFGKPHISDEELARIKALLAKIQAGEDNKDVIGKEKITD